MTEETCIRKRVIIDNENYYIAQSPTSVHVTVPFENRPERKRERKVVDILCQTVLNISNGI